MVTRIKGFCAFFDVCLSVVDRLSNTDPISSFCDVVINIYQFILKIRTHTCSAEDERYTYILETFHAWMSFLKSGQWFHSQNIPLAYIKNIYALKKALLLHQSVSGFSFQLFVLAD